MSPKQRPRLPAFAAQLLLGLPGLALITFVCFWIGFGLGRTAFAYVILIALISLSGQLQRLFRCIDSRRSLPELLLLGAAVRLPR